MTALILFSHGSLLCGAGEQLEVHAARLRKTQEYARVEIGYLNYSSPSFLEAVEKCANAGATKIFIAPYFLAAGYFVQVGLPKVLAPARAAFPKIEFWVAHALEDHALLADGVLACAARATPSENWRAILHSAPKSCEQNRECPLYDKCRGENFKIKTLTSDAASPSLVTRHSSLLVMVHGSPKPESNDAMFRVVEQVRARREYSRVAVGFMECNAPSIPDAIEELVENGAQRIVAVPYFLHAGTHVADDLPALLEAAQDEHSDVEFLMGDYLGREPNVTNVLQARLREAKPVE